jgi:hypothetical protein
MSSVTGATEDVGTATANTAQTQTKQGVAGLAKSAIAAGVLYKGFQGLKSSINTTQQLAKSTSAFARSSGLSKKESQSWVLVAQERGLETKQLQMGMATLGRNLGALGGSTKASSAMFDQLGVSQKSLMAMPMSQRMAAISDAFAKMPDGANKAALAQRIFGKSGTQLLPILNEGGKAMTDQLSAANDLVPAMGGSGKQALEMAKQQRELNMAMTGLKVLVGSALIPILSALLGAFLPIVKAIASLLHSVPMLTDVIVVLTAAIVTMMILQQVNKLLALFNLTLMSNPVMLVVAGIAALVIGLIIAYQKVGWFRDMVNGAFNAIKNVVMAVVNWIKDNWRILAVILAGILLGPLAAVAAAFFLLRDKVDIVVNAIKSAFTTVKTWVMGVVNGIVGTFASMPGKILGFFTSLPGKFKSLFTSVGNAIKSGFQAGFSGLLNIAKAPINAVINGLNRIHFSVPKWVPGVGGKGFGINIAPLAAGGIVTRPGMALVGERGPEVLSLPRAAQVAPLPPPIMPVQVAGSSRPIIVKTYLERRQIGQAIASYADELQASR